MPRATLATERFLHLSVGPQGRLATLDNALAACARFAMSEREALQAIDQIWRVVRQWRMYFDEFGVPSLDIERIAPAFRHIDDLSSPELRRKLP
jgi:serine/threonine-protein kinase HipA